MGQIKRMSDYPFIEDREWVRFRCLEVAARSAPFLSAEETIARAELFYNFVAPKATELKIARDNNDAAKIRKE